MKNLLFDVSRRDISSPKNWINFTIDIALNILNHRIKSIKNFSKAECPILALTDYAVLIDNEPSEFEVTYWAEKIDKTKDPRWIVYPWEREDSKPIQDYKI